MQKEKKSIRRLKTKFFWFKLRIRLKIKLLNCLFGKHIFNNPTCLICKKDLTLYRRNSKTNRK